MTSILLHPMSGLLSAYGMGLADIRATRQKALGTLLDDDAPAALNALGTHLSADCLSELTGQGIAAAAVEQRLRAHIRYEGTDTVLSIDTTFPGNDEIDRLRARFEAAHKRRFGFIADGKALVIDSVELEAIGGGAGDPEGALALDHEGEAPIVKRTRFFSDGEFHDAGVVLREQIQAWADRYRPAIIIEKNQTIVIEEGWQARLTAHDHVVLERIKPQARRVAVGTDADPVMLEIFNNLFMSIAEQMGVTLQNTAYSVNIKERLDFSCAVFDAAGHLVANAPPRAGPSRLDGRLCRDRYRRPIET